MNFLSSDTCSQIDSKMSSWFDAKQLTSFAKTALNEAQKTLDKALDINEGQEGEKLQTLDQNSPTIDEKETIVSEPGNKTNPSSIH